LSLSGGTLTNTQGQIVVNGNYTQGSGTLTQGDSFRVVGDSSFTGGTFTGNSGSTTEFQSDLTLDNVVFTSNGGVEIGTVGSSNTFDISGNTTLANSSSAFNIGDSDSHVDMNISGDASFTNTGGNDGSSFPWISNPGVDIHGNLTIGGTAASFTNTSGYTRITGDLTIDSGGSYSHITGTTRITGDLTINDGGSYGGDFDKGYVDNFTINGDYTGTNTDIDISGDFLVGSTGNFKFTGSELKADNVTINGTFDGGSASIDATGGAVNIGSSAIITFAGSSIVSDSFTMNMNANIDGWTSSPDLTTGNISFTGVNPTSSHVDINFGDITLNSNANTITSNNNLIDLSFGTLTVAAGGDMTFNSFADDSKVTGNIAISNGTLNIKDEITYSGDVSAEGNVTLVDVFAQDGFELYHNDTLLTDLTLENSGASTKIADIKYSNTTTNNFSSNLNLVGGNFIFKEAVKFGSSDGASKTLDVENGIDAIFYDVVSFEDATATDAKNVINVGSIENSGSSLYLGRGATFDTIDEINNNGTVYVGTVPEGSPDFNLPTIIDLGDSDLGAKINGTWVFGKENGSQRFELGSHLTLSGEGVDVTLNSDLTLRTDGGDAQNLTIENGAVLTVSEVAITGEQLIVRRDDAATTDVDESGQLITADNTSLKFNIIKGDVTNNGTMVIASEFEGGFIGTGTWYIEETGVALGRSPSTGIEGTIDNEGKVYFIDSLENDLILSNTGIYKNKGSTYIAGDLKLDGGSYINSGSNSETHIFGDADVENFNEGKWYFTSTFKDSNDTDLFASDEEHRIKLDSSEEVLIGSEAELYLVDEDGDSETSKLIIEQEILRNRGYVQINGDLELGSGDDDTLLNNEKGLIYDEDGNYVGESFPVFHVAGNTDITEINNKGGLILIDNTNTGSDTDNKLDQKTITNSDGGVIMIGFDGKKIFEDVKDGTINSSSFEFDKFVGDADDDNDTDKLIGGEDYNVTPVDLTLNEDKNQQIEITEGQFYLSGTLTLADDTSFILGDDDLDSNLSSYSGMFYKKDSFAYVGGLTVEEGSTLEINEDGFLYVDGDFDLQQNLVVNGSLYLNDDITIGTGNSITGDGAIYLGGVSSYVFSDKDEIVISLDVKADDGNSATLNYLQDYNGSSDSDYTFYNNIDFKVNDSVTSIIVDTETGAPSNKRERYFENTSNILVKDSGTLNIFIGNADNLKANNETGVDISDPDPINNPLTTDIQADYSSDKDDIIYLTSTNKDNDASLYIKNNGTVNAYGGTTVIGLGEVKIAGNLNVENENGLYLGTLDNFNNNPTDDVLYINGKKTDADDFNQASATNGTRVTVVSGGEDRAPVINLGEVEYTTIEGRSGYVVTEEAVNVSSMSSISDGVLGMNVNGDLVQVKDLNFQGISTSQDVVDILNQAFIDQNVAVTAVLTNDNKIKFSTEVGEGYYISLIDTISGSSESLIKNESSDYGVFGRDTGDDNQKHNINSDAEWLVQIESGTTIEDGGVIKSEVEDITDGSFGINYNGIQYVVDDLNFSGNTNGNQVVNAIEAEMATIEVESTDSNYKNIILAEADANDNGVIDGTELADSGFDLNSDGKITLDELIDVQLVDGKLQFVSIIGVTNQDDYANLSLFDTTYTGEGESLIKDPSISLGSLGGEKTTDVEGKGDVDEEEEIAGILISNSTLTSFAEVNMKYDSVILVGQLSSGLPTSAEDTYKGLMDNSISFTGTPKDAYFANDLYNEKTSTIIDGVETNVKNIEKGGVRVDNGGIFVSGNFHNYFKDDSNGESTYKSSHLYIGDGGAEDEYGDAFLYVAGDFTQHGSESELIVSSDGQVFIGGDMLIEDGSFLIASGGLVNLSGNLSFGNPDKQKFINNGEINFIGGTSDAADEVTTIASIPNFDGDGTYNFTRSASQSSGRGYFDLNLANNGGENNGNLVFENASVDWTISGSSKSKTFTNNGSIRVGDNTDVEFDFIVDDTPDYNPVGFVNLTTKDDSEFYVEKGSKVTIGKTTQYGEDSDKDGNLGVGEDLDSDNILDGYVGVGIFNVGTGNLTLRGELTSNGTYGTSTWGGTTSDNSKNKVWVNSGTMIVKNSVESKSNITIDQNGMMAIGYNWDGTTLTPIGYTNGIQLEVSNNNIIEEGSMHVAGKFINGIEGTYASSYFELGDGVDDSLSSSGVDSYLNILGDFVQQSNASTFIIEEDGRMYVKEDLDLRYGTFTLKDDGELLVGGNIYVGTEANNFTKEYGSGDDATVTLTGETSKVTSANDRIEVSGINKFEGTWNFDSTATTNKTAHYEVKNQSGDIELDGDVTVGNTNSGDISYDVLFSSASRKVINNNNLTNHDKITFSGTLDNEGNIVNEGVDAANKSEIIVGTLNNNSDFNNNAHSILTINNNFNNNDDGDFTNALNAELNLHGSVYNTGTFTNAGTINMYGGSTSSSATEISGISSLAATWNIESGYVEANKAIEIGAGATLSISENATFTSNEEFAINGNLNMAGGDLILNGKMLGSDNFDLNSFGDITVGEEANVIFTSETDTVNVVVDASGDVEHNLTFDTGKTSTLTSTSGANIDSDIRITEGDTLNVVGGNTTTTKDSSLDIDGTLTLNDDFGNSGDMVVDKTGSVQNISSTTTFYNEGKVIINYDETKHGTTGAIDSDTIVFEDKADSGATADGNGVTVQLNLESSIVSDRKDDILVMNSNNAIDTTNLEISDNITESYYLVSLEKNTADNTQLSYRVEIDTDSMIAPATMSENELTLGNFIQGLENNRSTQAPSKAMNGVINGVVFASDEEDLANRYDMLNLRIYNALETTAFNNSSIFRDAVLSNSDIYSTINVPMSFLAKNKSYQKSGLYNFGNPWFTAISNSYSGDLDADSAGYNADYDIDTTGAVLGYDFTTYGRKGRNFKISKYGLAGSVLQNETKETFDYNNAESYNLENTSIGFSGYYTYLTPSTNLKMIGSYMTHSGSYDRTVAIENGIEQAEGETSGTTAQVYLEAGLPFSNVNPFIFADLRSTSFDGFTETSETGAELEVADLKYEDTIVGAGLSIFESFQGNGSSYDKLNLTFGVKYGVNTSDDANTYDVRFIEDNTNQELTLNGNARVGDVMNSYISADIIKDNLNYKLQYQMDKDDLGSGSSLMLKVLILN
jgi:hypothetical protein